MFWSDLGTAVGYEAIGIVNSSLPTVAVFAKYDPVKDAKKDTKEDDKLVGAVQAAPCPPAGSPESAPNYGKGVIFYMKKDRIVGILLWNVFNRISIARKLLTSDETFDDLNEVAKLFDIFEQQDKPT